MLGMSPLFVQSYAQSYNSSPSPYETIVDNISGEVMAGEIFDLYYYEEHFIRELSRWKYIGKKDRTLSYSEHELYEKCLSEAYRIYGSAYPDFRLRNFTCSFREQNLPDYEYGSNEIGSSTHYKKSNRKRKIYTYSATIVVSY